MFFFPDAQWSLGNHRIVSGIWMLWWEVSIPYEWKVSSISFLLHRTLLAHVSLLPAPPRLLEVSILPFGGAFGNMQVCLVYVGLASELLPSGFPKP